MPRSWRMQFIVLFVSIALLAALNTFVLHGKLSHIGAGLIAKSAAFVYERSSIVREFIRLASEFRSLADENRILRERTSKLEYYTAQSEELERENAFLRKTLGIPQEGTFIRSDARIFSVTVTPTGSRVLIDRGLDVGVMYGDVATTPTGDFIGIVSEVFERYSVVRLATDPTFETAARVRGRDTTGIVRGGAEQGRGMWLELVVQNDEIAEGDTIISSGSDILPPGLVIGRVEYVKSDETELFKQVRINPIWDRLLAGQVLILRRQ